MSRNVVHRFIVAYDITDDWRRNRVSKALESFGDRIQYSVFLVDTKPSHVVLLRNKLAALANLKEDSILFCDLGPLGLATTARLDFMGRERGYTGQGPLVF